QRPGVLQLLHGTRRVDDAGLRRPAAGTPGEVPRVRLVPGAAVDAGGGGEVGPMTSASDSDLRGAGSGSGSAGQGSCGAGSGGSGSGSGSGSGKGPVNEATSSSPGWTGAAGEPTRFLLLRHGQ